MIKLQHAMRALRLQAIRICKAYIEGPCAHNIIGPLSESNVTTVPCWLICQDAMVVSLARDCSSMRHEVSKVRYRSKESIPNSKHALPCQETNFLYRGYVSMLCFRALLSFDTPTFTCCICCRFRLASQGQRVLSIVHPSPPFPRPPHPQPSPRVRV